MCLFDRLHNNIKNSSATVELRETAVDRFYTAVYVADGVDTYEVEYWDGMPVTIRRQDCDFAMTREDEQAPWMVRVSG